MTDSCNLLCTLVILTFLFFIVQNGEFMLDLNFLITYRECNRLLNWTYRVHKERFLGKPRATPDVIKTFMNMEHFVPVHKSKTSGGCNKYFG